LESAALSFLDHFLNVAAQSLHFLRGLHAIFLRQVFLVLGQLTNSGIAIYVIILTSKEELKKRKRKMFCNSVWSKNNICSF
jgi:hypothetical protein